MLAIWASSAAPEPAAIPSGRPGARTGLHLDFAALVAEPDDALCHAHDTTGIDLVAERFPQRDRIDDGPVAYPDATAERARRKIRFALADLGRLEPCTVEADPRVIGVLSSLSPSPAMATSTVRPPRSMAHGHVTFCVRYHLKY
jgi:hypothetical protein